jgi:hypothetical protein
MIKKMSNPSQPPLIIRGGESGKYPRHEGCIEEALQEGKKAYKRHKVINA